MSDPINTFNTSGNWGVDASRNAGTFQAQQGQQSSPQQANESALAYQNRQAAYDSAKRGN